MLRSVAAAILFLTVVPACSPSRETEPSGPIARLGSAPTIDGVFDAGEWDDAEVVLVGANEQFRMKHDGVNLYFAVRAGGGELRFNTDAGLRILHWSAQLGSAEYVKSDASTQRLDKPFAFELWGLYHESPNVIQETLAGYLAENGWAANTASTGNLMESEVAVSFDWLGVDVGPARFVELPSVRVEGGLMISRDDPRAEELAALSREDLGRRYPPVAWPAISVQGEPADRGLPDTIRVNPADYGRIWIDLQR